MPQKVLTMAGSDASGGAGLEADLKVFEEFKTYGLAAISCIVTMDPAHNFFPTVHELDTNLFEKQCATAFVDNDLAAVKTGMLVSDEKIELAGKILAQNKQPNIIIDPVMICKQGDNQYNLKNAIIKHLLPLATITTPNLLEAEILSETKIETLDDMAKAAQIIHQLGASNVVIKGGHRLQTTQAVDLFYDGQQFTYLEKPKITTNYNHGAGCSFAAAITANLAYGKSPLEATKIAKEFVYAAIKNGFMANHYTGHVFHGAYNFK